MSTRRKRIRRAASERSRILRHTTRALPGQPRPTYTPPRAIRILWPAVLALLLVLGFAVAAHFSGARAASAAPASRGWEGRAAAPALPAVLHFTDAEHGTAFVLWLQDVENIKAGTFVFTLSDQRQLKGFNPVTNNSVYEGLAKYSSSASLGCLDRIVTPTAEDPATVYVTGRFDPSGLAAYVQVQYLDCAQHQSGEAVLVSGCTPTACTDVLGQVSASVQQYDASVIAAAADRSPAAWRQVYNQVSLTTQGQYTPQQFAATINQQLATVGQITAISPISNAPIITYDTGGQAFFSVKQQVTYSLNGTSSTRDVTSYYVLESGRWVFWFSA